MNWKNIIGQDAVQHHLLDMVQHNRLSHALLFLGKEGSGVLPIAIEFAKYVVSKPLSKPVVEDLFGSMSQLPADDADNTAAVQRAEQLIHPDLHFSFPVISKTSGEKPVSADYITQFRTFVQQLPYGNVYDWLQSINAENKQGNITAEECNDIIKKLSLKSYESEYKILVLWMPEYLGKEGNKLLKLIEEPPPNTLFFLVAENEDNILPTILSRCQLIKIPTLTNTDIEQALINRANADAATAHQIAQMCEGNYREALNLLQHIQNDWEAMVRDWLKFINRKMLADQIKWVDEISKLGREKQKQFLRYFNHLLHQSIRLAVLGSDNIYIPETEKDFAARLLRIATVSKQEAIIEEIDKAAYYIERNANAKMLFTALTLKLNHIINNNVSVLV